MPQIDLAPATLQLAAIVAAIPDDMLGHPTPCPDYSVADLLSHVNTLAVAFADAADKVTDPDDQPAPGDPLPDLPMDWRSEIAGRLGSMTDAWRRPEAWEGMTRVGGVDLPGEACGLVGLNEVIVHCWDLARSTDQRSTAPDELLASLLPILGDFASPDGNGPFGPAVSIPADAPLIDRVLGLTGRDPAWCPPHASN